MARSIGPRRPGRDRRDDRRTLRRETPVDGEPDRMLPAEAYTSRRGAGLGAAAPVRRQLDLPGPGGRPAAGPARAAGDPAGRGGGRRRRPAGAGRRAVLRMFANTCRHRGHELLPEGETSQRRSIVCPYHAWTYDLAGRALKAPRGSATSSAFDPGTHAPRRAAGAGVAGLGVRARRCTPAAAGRCRRSTSTSATSAGLRRAVRMRGARARRPAHLRGRGELEGDRRELPRVLPLPADPSRAVPGQPRRTPATTTTCPAPGSAARWTCATAWRRCR